MSGGDLFTNLCKREHFTVEEVQFIIAEIVLAFERLHRRGIIYRDIKLGAFQLLTTLSSDSREFILNFEICHFREYFARYERSHCRYGFWSVETAHKRIEWPII